MAIQLRAAIEGPVPLGYRILGGAPDLFVRHPGYDDSNNVMISFTATDGDDNRRGVQRGLVHTACAIIAGNRFDGWLSTARQPHAESRPGEDNYGDMLPVGNYYFHVPLDTSSLLDPALSLALPYPVVPNFREWMFPTDSATHCAMLPTMWKAPDINYNVALQDTRVRDVSCRLTAHVTTTEIAHIIPAAEKTWAGRNNMGIYHLGAKRGQDVVDGAENHILLRRDAHDQWDRRMFSIVPKKRGQDGWAWTLHVNETSQELHQLYHNRQLQLLSGVRREFLFARFAWDIFPNIHGFLQFMVDRRLKLRDGSVRDCPGPDCKQYCEDQGRFRSATRSKRRLKQTSSASGEQGDEEESSSEESGDDSDPYGFRRSREMEEIEMEEVQARYPSPDPRGRKRWRHESRTSCK